MHRPPRRDRCPGDMIGFNQDFEAAPAASPLAPLVANTFGASGWLPRDLGLEHRPQQEAMANAVAAALEANESLLFEAGTGVGKSLAYLIPALLHALEQERPCIVSSNTISLQEQIQKKDLDLCRSLFKKIPELENRSRFRTALLLGKANYLCTYRLSRAIETRADLFGGAEQEELQRLAEWSQETADGLVQELSPPPPYEVWEQVNADASACNRKNCTPETCPYQRARANLRKAHLIIVNHSLLFALINAGAAPAKGKGVLFPDDFVIIDEAHTLPAIATDHFGLNLSSAGLQRLLHTLYNPNKNRGLLVRHGHSRHQQAVVDAAEAAAQFFGFIRDRILGERTIVRLREEGWAEPTLGPPLRALIQHVGSIIDRIAEDSPAHSELRDQKRRLESYATGINQCLGLAAEDHVHWVERTGKQGRNVTLRNAPIDIAPHLRECLFQRETSVVLTSATLAPAGNMQTFQEQVGAEHVPATAVSSPFDFDRNMQVYLATDVPAPASGNGRLALEALADYIHFCAGRVNGGTLVLFTSYQDMRKVALDVEETFQKMRRPFFIQGRDFSRTELTRRFARAGNGILFGTDSFWTGVDIPGPALSQIIITRLPFENPTHPVLEAKCEWIRARGGNPFAEFTLPRALIKFRQGVGRLIRGKSDRGVITLLDTRLLQKTYGRLFLSALPQPRFHRLTRANRENTFVPPT